MWGCKHSELLLRDDAIMKDEVAERILTVNATANRNVDEINARLDPHRARFNRKVNEIIQSRRLPKEMKFYALRDLVDEVNKLNGDNVACKLGCAHCCHIAVALTYEEAKAIGKRIGIQPRRVPLRAEFNDFDFGYHNPCTFLKDNLCTIYENRPLACRLYFSLDVDSLLCQFDDADGDLRGTRPVPTFNRTEFHLAILRIADPPQRKCLADIRAFFPRR